MWLLIFSAAFGQEVLYQEDVSTGIKEVVVNADQTIAAFLESNSGFVYLLSEKDWEITAIDACSSTAGGLVFDSLDILYVGCDGTGVITIDTTKDNEISTEGIAVDTEGFQAFAIYNDDLYVMGENPSGGNPRVHLVDLAAGAEITSSFPSTLGYSSVADFERVGSFLIVAHSGANLSKVDPISGGITRDQDGPTTGSVSDILPVQTASNALVAAGTGGVLRFLFASNDTQFAAAGADLKNVTALVADDSVIWVADSTSDSLKSFTYESGSATMGNEIQKEIDLDLGSAVQEMGMLGDYIIIGTDSGIMQIVGSGPWVEGGSVFPSSLTGEDDFTFTFVSTQAGDFEIRLNADSDAGGTLVSSGAVEANTALEVTLRSADSYKEGDNGLRIVVTAEDGTTGHDTVYVNVDTPPSTPDLTSASVGFGDERITVSFDGIEDSDLSHYIVYISDSEFTAADYATGGPSFKDISEEERMITAEPSEAVSLTLTGLVNEQLYYVGVRAYDKGGAESKMSSIFSVTPKETLSAAELSGEEGGFCGISTQAGILSLGVAMILVGFRRKEVLLGLGLLVFPQVGEATSQVATAAVADDEKIENFRQFSDVRYGPITFTHDAINYVFTDSNHQILYLDTGYTFRDVIGVSLGLGLVREKGFLVDATGAASSTQDTLSVLPLNVSGIIRADFFADQLLVPYASAGYDHWLWREKWGDEDAGTDGSLSGDKQGWHYAMGGQLLLDPFDKVSASLMEVKRGIRDTYLSVEYRKQTFDQDGIDFDSDSYTVGFCFTY